MTRISYTNQILIGVKEHDGPAGGPLSVGLHQWLGFAPLDPVDFVKWGHTRPRSVGRAAAVAHALAWSLSGNTRGRGRKRCC